MWKLVVANADGLINGELFLDLSDDTELLGDLELSRAFKKLVKKATQVVSDNSLRNCS